MLAQELPRSLLSRFLRIVVGQDRRVLSQRVLQRDGVPVGFGVGFAGAGGVFEGVEDCDRAAEEDEAGYGRAAMRVCGVEDAEGAGALLVGKSTDVEGRSRPLDRGIDEVCLQIFHGEGDGRGGVDDVCEGDLGGFESFVEGIVDRDVGDVDECKGFFPFGMQFEDFFAF